LSILPRISTASSLYYTEFSIQDLATIDCIHLAAVDKSEINVLSSSIHPATTALCTFPSFCLVSVHPIPPYRSFNPSWMRHGCHTTQVFVANAIGGVLSNASRNQGMIYDSLKIELASISGDNSLFAAARFSKGIHLHVEREIMPCNSLAFMPMGITTRLVDLIIFNSFVFNYLVDIRDKSETGLAPCLRLGACQMPKP